MSGKVFVTLSLYARPLAAAVGVAASFAFAPHRWFFLAVLAFALLFALAAVAATPRRAAAAGFWFGAGLHGAGVYWVYYALHNFGGMAAPLAVVFTAVLAVYLAMFGAASAFAFRFLLGRFLAGGNFSFLKRGAPAALLFAACWTAGEGLRAVLFGGFPWLMGGYAHTPPSPLAGFAPALGVLGVTFIATAMSALWGAPFIRPQSKPGAVLLAPPAVATMIICFIGFALLFAPFAKKDGALQVSLLQGNIPQDEKFDAVFLNRALDKYERLAHAAAGELIVMPETALPLLLENLPPARAAALRAAVAQPASISKTESETETESESELEKESQTKNGAVLAGVFVREGEAIYNGAAVFGRGEEVGMVFKRRLVLFGEYVPLGDWLREVLEGMGLAIPFSNLSAGDNGLLRLPLAALMVNICFDEAFGNDFRETLPKAQLLVNMTNDAWYGKTRMMDQHFQIGQMRALETSRWMVRATNTGRSGVIDHLGRARAVLPQDEEGILNAEVELRAGATPYVLWGDAPVWAAVFVVLAVFGIKRRRGVEGVAKRNPKRLKDSPSSNLN